MRINIASNAEGMDFLVLDSTEFSMPYYSVLGNVQSCTDPRRRLMTGDTLHQGLQHPGALFQNIAHPEVQGTL